MADKDFVVKNGLVVNTDLIVANGDSNRVGINTSNPDATLTVSGTANVSGNAVFSANVSIGGTITINGLRANGSLGANNFALFSNGTVAYWQSLATLGGGYYKGNAGTTGDVSGAQNLYRINANTQSNNVTIESGENAYTTGPMTIASGYNLTVSSGGRVIIL